MAVAASCLLLYAVICCYSERTAFVGAVCAFFHGAIGNILLLSHAQLAERLAAAGARGRTLTLKLKRRKAGAPEPRKFLGALTKRVCLICCSLKYHLLMLDYFMAWVLACSLPTLA